MPANFSQAAKVFFTPGTFFPFLLGSTCLSVIGNSFTTLILTNWLHATSWAAERRVRGTDGSRTWTSEGDDQSDVRDHRPDRRPNTTLGQLTLIERTLEKETSTGADWVGSARSKTVRFAYEILRQQKLAHQEGGPDSAFTLSHFRLGYQSP